jgi:hypothetical protein
MATPSFRVTDASTYRKGRGSASSRTRTSSGITASNLDPISRLFITALIEAQVSASISHDDILDKNNYED